ncbi:MAG: tRNA (guanine37-N1)-methyltransferase [Chloroflexi bacterium]|jgi:tRNA (guanine37-N1)-methyltransferase|nr:MAG: tRNA (guanine37-N1)-methyltransferase [Chloroflexota bacterium]
MRFHILTLFPSFFDSPFQSSILGRAVTNGLVDIRLYDIRDYTLDRHRTADDYLFGGGSGMLMKVEPLARSIEAVRENVAQESSVEASQRAPVILLSPQGRVFSQAIAEELAVQEDIVLICGHYEGVDQRVREHLATDEISLGDFVVTGGEAAAVVMVDAVSRLQAGVVGDPQSVALDSHSSGLLQHPQYTRPRSFQGWDVPDVLLSGNHADVERWRRQQSLLRTLQRRPDLLARATLSKDDVKFLAEHGYSGLDGTER